MINYHSKFVLLIILINGSLLAQTPKWAQTGSHKKYPQSNYLLGVGIADNKAEAVELARADVAKQIQVKIESELETMEQEISSDDRSVIHAEVVSRTKSAVSETITGIEIVESENVKGKQYVLAVLNKQNYLAGLEQEMDKIIKESNRFTQSARELVRQGNLFNALDNYISAQNTIPEFYINRGLYTALTGIIYGGKDVESVASILSEIRALLAGIDIKIVSGDNQSAVTGTTLKNPVVAKVYYTDKNQDEVGLKWYPVIIKYTNGETISKVGSASDGLLSINIVASPTGASSGSGTVVFTLGLSNLPDIFRNDLTKIQTAAHYTLLIADLSFSTEVKDIDGNINAPITELISSLINSNGYKNDPAANLIILGKTTISNEKTVGSPAGKQYFVEMDLHLSLVDNEAGTKLASVSGRGRGLAIGSRENAIQKAYENINIPKSKFAAFLQTAIQP